MLKMFVRLFIFTILLIRTLAEINNDNLDVISLQQNIEHGGAKFPDEISLNFNHNGNNVVLKLVRDDATTEILSESIFETSPHLPSNVYSDARSEDFAAYTSESADIIAHRESSSSHCRFYGRFMRNAEKMTIGSVDGDHVLHRVTREAEGSWPSENVLELEMDTSGNMREKRAAADQNTVELFMFADYSIYDHFNNSVQQGQTNSFLKLYIRDYMISLTRDLDTLFSNMENYGSLFIRIYFQQYQVATKLEHTPWVKDNLVPTDTLVVDSALSELIIYYEKLVTKFAFPSPDHLMVLTRYALQGGEQYGLKNSMCISRPEWSVSIVNTYYFPKAMAQAIALAFSNSITFDGSENACSNDDYYVMSSHLSPTPDSKRGNYWKFSSCNTLEFNTTLTNDIGSSLSCLRAQDQFYDFDAFLANPPYGSKYTADEQCQNAFGGNSSFCNNDGGTGVDCFSSRDGCISTLNVCTSYRVGDETPCQGETNCSYGICQITPDPTSSSSSSDEDTTTDGGKQTSTLSTVYSSSSEIPSTLSSTIEPSSGTPSAGTTTDGTTTDGGKQTTTTVGTTTDGTCVITTGVVEFNLPGCGCCGGCGCDETCSECEGNIQGRPAYTLTDDNCTLDENCCPDKVTITTYFVPEGCPLDFTPSDDTIIVKNKGWEVTDLDVKAELYQDRKDDWQIKLVPHVNEKFMKRI